MVDVKATGNGEITATTRKFTREFGRNENEKQCHCVEVNRADWMAYSRDDGPDTMACIEAVTNGASPLMVCVCDINPSMECPCSDIDRNQIPAVLQPGMSETLPAGKPWSLAKLPLLGEIVNGCIEQQCEYYASPKWDVTEVTGATVYSALERECGEHWMDKKFMAGTHHDRPAVEDILEKALLAWLRQLFPKVGGKNAGKPSGKGKKNLLLDLKRIRKGVEPEIPLFTGQQVHARWVTLTGTLDTAVNNANPLGAANGFLGAIVRRARDAGFWVVRFTEDNKIHNFIPRKYVKLVNEPALSVDE